MIPVRDRVWVEVWDYVEEQTCARLEWPVIEAAWFDLNWQIIDQVEDLTRDQVRDESRRLYSQL